MEMVSVDAVSSHGALTMNGSSSSGKNLLACPAPTLLVNQIS